MYKKSGTKAKYSGRPVAVRPHDTVAVIQVVFCLHAFNIPYYRDNYNPLCYQTVVKSEKFNFRWI